MNLADRLLDPEKVEEALGEIEDDCISNPHGAYGYMDDIAEVVRELHRRLAAAKAEGAAEAYEAEAQEWAVYEKSSEGLHDQGIRRSYGRRKLEASDRAAAIRKVAAKEGK